MKRRHLPDARTFVVGLLVVLAACQPGDEPEERSMMHTVGAVDTAGLRAKAVPAEFQPGQALFEENCAVCHGEAALGTEQGPPLVHTVYEPNHHADFAFYAAVGQGVRAHHWNFGDMPAVPALGPANVEQVIAYVRWLQREAGVY